LEKDEMKKKTYRSFTKARDYARSLHLDTFDDWRKHVKSGKLPDDIPSAPNTVYKNQYKGVGDWLGTGRVADKYKTWRPFKEAKRFAISLHLESKEKWDKYAKSGKLPDDIPTSPGGLYKNKGWKGWPDFLGNKRVVKYTKNNTRPFEECKKFVRSLGIKTDSEWQKWWKKNERPIDIPYQPERIYKEWTTWRDFLGPLPERWKSFEDARKYAQSLNLKSPREWSQLSKSKKRPNDIPANPFTTYQNKGWITWSDFLGTGNLNVQQLRAQYYSYSDAQKYVQKQGIKMVTEFQKWSSQGKRPIFITASPHKFYKEWTDWYNFLGTKKRVNRSFEDARKYAQSLNLKFNRDWVKLHKEGKIPKDIPRYPDRDIYGDKWTSMADFLGTGNLSPSDKRKQMRSYEECKKFVRSLGIKTENQWRAWCKNNKRPINIPYSFQPAYPKEWISMGEFLGTGFIADKNKVWKKFDEAKKIVQKYGFKNMDEFKKAWNSGKISKNIPANPGQVYKNKGWVSSGDFLGTGNVSYVKLAETYLPWKEAKPIYQKLAKKHGLKNGNDWRKFARTHQKLLRDLGIPSRPSRSYSKERVLKKMK
jgi:hypothetical protein